MSTATLAIVGAEVLTMDPEHPRATAIALDGERVLAVGDDAEVKAVCTGSTEVLGGDGWCVTPGLTDGHQHLLYGAALAQGIDFDRVPNLDAIRAELALAASDAGDWILGFGLEYEALGGAPYHHSMVDGVTAGRPMLVHALDLHTSFVNAAALERTGIDGPRNFPDGSRIVCDDEGRPTGELREQAAMRVALDALPEPSRAEEMRRWADTIRRQNAVGITAIHQMNGSPDVLEAFAALEEAGQLSMHVAIYDVIAPGTDPAYADELVRRTPPRGRRWRADGIKFWLDGVVETGTAWLEGAEEGEHGGAPLWPSLEEFEDIASRCHAAGLRIATHAIGDRAVRETLDVYARLPGGAGRHRIEHIETAPDETIARFRPQGVTASMQPIHLRWSKPDLSDPWSTKLTHAQCAHAWPSGDLTADGAVVVLGSDWPVAPFDPRLGFYAARLRRSPDAEDPRPIGASRPLTGVETLAGYTVNAARAIGDEAVAGLLRPGYRADLVAWGEDPTACAADDLPGLPVLLTVGAGEVVHRASA